MANHFYTTQEEIRESVISFLSTIVYIPEKVPQRIAQVQMSKV
jgi:hypothetical protein